MSNPYQELARRNKAERLAHELFVCGISGEQAADFDSEIWDLVSQRAGVREPSLETRAMVVRILKTKEEELCQRS